jgi:VDE lipocalin domain
VLVRYKGHTLQGSYEGGFVYSRYAQLPQSAEPAVFAAARAQGIAPDSLLKIDNACPSEGELPTAGGADKMNIVDRVKYEAGFLYDLLEWVKPGTINKYD